MRRAIRSGGGPLVDLSLEAPPTLEWQPYICHDANFADFSAGTRVLDIGCGDGLELTDLQRAGCMAAGIETKASSLVRCRRLGLRMIHARAEELPVRTHSIDGIVCKVVVPYTDEARVLAEIGRVLKPGGHAVLCYHGVGYFVRHLLAGHFKERVYGLRSVLNTWLYAATGKRLPGFLGDTLYQSERRLTRYYRTGSLTLRHERPAKRFLGLPVFIYHTVERTS